MKRLKRRSKLILLFLVLVLIGLFLFIPFNTKREAKGDRIYGGVFTYSLPENVTSLFPLETNALSDLRVISQIYDPLVKQSDSKGNIQNQLVEKITVSPNRKLVTIQLKKGILFHDDECFTGESREMKAADVAFTLTFACSNHNHLNQSASLLKGKIMGSDKYYNEEHLPNKNNFVSGIHVTGPYSLEINLSKPYNHFIQLLTHPSLGIMSLVAWEHYGNNLKYHPIGSGPFYLKSSTKTKIELARNDDYWQHDSFGNQLPFLDEVHVLTNTKLSEEYPMFSQEKIDLLFDLPVNELEKAFGSLSDAQQGKNLLHRVHIQKASKIHYISWNMNKPPFNNPSVRKAFSLAIDRDLICTDILKGDGQALKQGFIPQSSYYSNPTIPVLIKNSQEAKHLLAESGYNDQHPFPVVHFYVNAQKGSNADLWCKEFSRQLKEGLNVRLKLIYVSTKKRDEKIKAGEALLWKAGWVGDYPDAESYLRLFYQPNRGKSIFVPAQQSQYNQLYLTSILTTNEQEKRKLQQACEAIVIQESGIIPIYSEDFFVMVNLRVRGFEMNSSGIIDFSTIYLKKVV
ncbi:MAG: ABC transporter substrate-binding protein [Flavobacteriales bacterium]